MHQPVLLKEAISFLNPHSNEHFIDCTLGEGGHAEAVLQKTKPHGTLLGIDRDPLMLARAKKRLSRFGKRVRYVNDTYANLQRIAAQEGFTAAHGVLFDLGVAATHFNERGRGFSFTDDISLDMRFNPREGIPSAAELLSQKNERALEEIFREYGDERYARRIARAIIRTREKHPLVRARDLAACIARAVPAKKRGVHVATRVFQALRIAVNDEYTHLYRALPQALATMVPGGRLVVISFHSGEDGIVKHFFAKEAQAGTLSVLTKKPITADKEECQKNPRARSAKLRAAQRTTTI